VLDDVARGLEVTRDGVRTAPRVVARYGGKGAFRVAETLRDGRACLRIPPDGGKRCVDTPPAGGVALTKLRARLTGVRTSRPATFDRVVLDFAAGKGVPAHRVAYDQPPLNQAGSRRAVSIAGNRLLRVRLRHVARSRRLGHDGTVWSPNPAIAQVEDLGTFEGRRTIGIGFRAPPGTRPPFRVTALDHRLVVDIARRR
jgi:hypothetical protein